MRNPEEDRVPGRQDSPLRREIKHHKLLVSRKLRQYKEREKLSFDSLFREISEFWSGENPKKVVDLGFSYEYLKKLASPKPSDLRPTTDTLNLFYRFLDSNGAWDSRAANRDEVSRVGDHTYYSMLEFFEIPEMTTTNLLGRLPGVYRVYRPILTHPGRYVVGAIIVRSNEDTGLLSYREHNAIQRLEGREAKSVTFEGYAFRKSNFVVFLATDTAKSAIHLTMLSNCEVEGDKYITMFGGFMDTLGGQVYSGRVFIERLKDVGVEEVDEGVLFSQCCCIDQDQLPPSILKYFMDKDLSEDVRIY